MVETQFAQIWREQCDACVTIRTRFGRHAAFEYIVLEKLLLFSGAATDHIDFARELPSFVARVRQIFTTQELREEFARFESEVEQEADEGSEDELNTNFEDDFSEPQTIVAARAERFALIKQLLLSAQLGVS